MNKKKKVLIISFLLIGVSLLLYPQISDIVARIKQRMVIEEYSGTIEMISEDRFNDLRDRATKYNEDLYIYQKQNGTPKESLEGYNEILTVDESGMFGHISIPSISVQIPIYHGTNESVLQVGIGHTSYSSFPIGGKNTHAVLFGHSGLPRAKLFTDLEQLNLDDYFIVSVLNQSKTYKIIDIHVIEPDELINYIGIEDGKDLVSLVTCTPHGINSHRLVIKGERTENIDAEAILASTEEQTTKSSFLYLICSIVFVLIIIISIVIAKKIRRKHEKA